MAKPVIATDMPGCRDAVDHELTRLNLRTKIARVARRRHAKDAHPGSDRLTQMGRRARTKMERQFDEALVHQAYRDALRCCAAHASVGPSTRNDRNPISMTLQIYLWRESRPQRPSGARGHRAYVVGDVHGRLELLDQLLAKIEADSSAGRRGKACWCSSGI